MNPIPTLFLDIEKENLWNILHDEKKVNLNRTKTKLTLPFLRFKLGDTLRFVIYHNERHIVQATRVKEAMTKFGINSQNQKN